MVASMKPFWLVTCILTMSTVLRAEPALFNAPEKLTGSDAKYRMSRNPSRNLAVDSRGHLHFVYWSGGDVTTPSQTSTVSHREWTPGGGWQAPEIVDDSFVDLGAGPQRMGGRNPSLAILADDTAVVAWHDHRHCNPDLPFNSINNIEIYLDKKISNGMFGNTDTRLTNTTAAHLGDNGYLPRILARGDGSLAVTWYDYNDGGTVSDLYIALSDTAGVFPAEPLSARRLTNRGDRGGTPEYTVPDIAEDGSGDLFITWGTGSGGAGESFSASVPVPTGTVAPTSLATSTGAFFDPARAVSSPDGSIWQAYTDRTGGEFDIALARRSSASAVPAFNIRVLAAVGVHESDPDLAFDAAGNGHLVWVDDAEGQNVWHARIASDGTVSDRTRVTPTAGPWARPVVALDGNGRAWVAFEEDTSSTSGALWIASEVGALSAVTAGWEMLP